MKKIIYSIISMLIASCLSFGPVFAGQYTNNSVNNNSNTQAQANVLTGCAAKASSSNGAGIMCIIEQVADILSAGVGVLAFLGIVIVGIQYITSGGNEAKMAMAKKRIVEIVIGVLLYAVLYAIVKFLMPNA